MDYYVFGGGICIIVYKVINNIFIKWIWYVMKCNYFIVIFYDVCIILFNILEK